MEARFYGHNETIHYEFEWLFAGLRPTNNLMARLGSPKVISRSGGAGGVAIGTGLRVHRCVFNPCNAVYPPSKYGLAGPPMHVQPSDWRPPAEAAVAAPPAPPEQDALPPLPAPAAPPPDLPGEPTGQPLQPLSAAAPLPAAPGAAVAAQSAVAEGAPLAQLSESRVLQKLLQLARDIRRPCAYIGYSALICFGLARGCRPFVWEGANRIDLIAAYAPWAIGRCTKECAVDAVVCCMMSAVAGGRVLMVPVSEITPLSACNHLIAAVSMGDMLPGGGDSTEAFYSSMGMALLGTVVNGDCGIDAACQMLGLPQTADQRGLLREEPGPCQKSLGC